MLRKIHAKLAGPVILAALMIHISGCTAVGFTSGAIIDEAKKSETQKEAWQIGSLRKGKRVTAILRDSTSITGDYQGLYELERQEYSERYENADLNSISKAAIPAVNDSLIVVLDEKSYSDNCFNGFGYKYRRAFKTSKSDQIAGCFYLSSNSKGDHGENRFYLDKVSEIIDSRGKSISGSDISKLISSGQIPIKTCANLYCDNGIRKVPVTEVDHIKYRTKNTKWWLMGLGLAFDIIILAALSSADLGGGSMMGSGGGMGWY